MSRKCADQVSRSLMSNSKHNGWGKRNKNAKLDKNEWRRDFTFAMSTVLCMSFLLRLSRAHRAQCRLRVAILRETPHIEA